MPLTHVWPHTGRVTSLHIISGFFNLGDMRRTLVCDNSPSSWPRKKELSHMSVSLIHPTLKIKIKFNPYKFVGRLIPNDLD